MSSDNISKIKERLSVVDVISGYIKVQKSGVNFKARCPFHNEKTPSFYISPERQIWHCFGCQKGGDIFGFVKEIEGVEFSEALRILAQTAGVKLESFDPTVRDAKANLYEISETAARFFEKQLYYSPAGKKALFYLKNRGLTEDITKEFRLGFAPDDWHSLGNFLRDCSFLDKDIINAGLSLRRDNGSDIYDRFRSRIIFPITDINDRVVGFTGRIFSEVLMKDEGAKYINTPQTEIYDKSRVLYGLNKAKLETRRADRCLLVEGNMDAIMPYQAGVKNVVATSGTALTPSHLQLLQRYTNNLDFCFDTDKAGLLATRRGIGLALSQNFNIKIVHLNDPECKDPADYVKKFGQKWIETVKTSKPVIEFYFDKLRSELDLTSVESKKLIIANLGPLIKRLPSNVEKSHWIFKIASVLKTKNEAVEADLLAVRDDLDIYVASRPELDRVQVKTSKPSEEDIFEEALLAVIIKKPFLFKDELGGLNVEDKNFFFKSIINRLNDVNLESFNFSDFSLMFDEVAKMKLEFVYLKSQELLKDFSDDELKTEFNSLIKKLEHRLITARLAGLELGIKSAESEKDRGRLVELMTQFGDLTKKLKKLF